jgi:hypothetical protein
METNVSHIITLKTASHMGGKINTRKRKLRVSLHTLCKWLANKTFSILVVALK